MGRYHLAIEQIQKWVSEEGKETRDADLRAISEALGIARKETTNARNTYITIVSDSQKALQTIQQPGINQENRVLRPKDRRTPI